MDIKRKWIVAVSVAGIVMASLAIALTFQQRSEILVDTGETRRKVETSYQKLMPATARSARDEKLVVAARRFSQERYVASLWVIDRSGQIAFHEGGPGKVGDNVKTLAARVDMDRMLDSLSKGALSKDEQLQLLAVAAIRSEGEHNDVYRHLVHPVLNKTGEQVALVAFAYDVSPGISGPFTAFDIIPTLIVFLGFALYWFGLPLWVWLDARDKGEVAVFWGFFVLLTNLVGLLAYLIAVAKPRSVDS